MTYPQCPNCGGVEWSVIDPGMTAYLCSCPRCGLRWTETYDLGPTR